MRRTIQTVIQLIFLLMFITLFIMGKIQIWMGVFVLGILLSFVLGRVFCGYVCPINTVMRFVCFVKRKLHIKSFKIPQFIKKPWVRYAMLGLFIAFLILTIVTGKKLPVLPALFVLGFVLTLFFPESLWHRYLCPYGSILKVPSTKSAHYIKIDAESCTNCSACSKACPTNAIEKTDNQHQIIKNECIVCYNCMDKCTKGAISYK